MTDKVIKKHKIMAIFLIVFLGLIISKNALATTIFKGNTGLVKGKLEMSKDTLQWHFETKPNNGMVKIWYLGESQKGQLDLYLFEIELNGKTQTGKVFAEHDKVKWYVQKIEYIERKR